MSDKAHREQIVTWQFPRGRASTGLEANRGVRMRARHRRDSGVNGKWRTSGDCAAARWETGIPTCQKPSEAR
ncbi:protein of unknown function [Cupriavidus neocaledonicus]|uniref:Uncharacterized protein n=1 Tax=Cupriavidus neocaledonicus TaxID=1040979 RepID=A0A375H906_9BURK|nr:hypothetical protein CBM2605_A310021 [Cupriavidus neocaledonicus]SPD48574.1 protein of unknown function [Cupriavidus neocaledonicus]